MIIDNTGITNGLSVSITAYFVFSACNDDGNHCLDSGEAVLKQYGYISDDFYLDISIMISFCILLNVCGYFGLRRKMRKQPAY